ncbi:MAG: hypothetical protein ACI837_000792 [Crocinitomicaceae bacterium]|jgi:hypothetical protein
MTWKEYTHLFKAIVSGEICSPPYDNADYVDYVTLNQSRQKRWTKRGILNEELVNLLENVDKTQYWTVITEPWCGDASHLVPFMFLLSEVSDNIHFKISLRDGKGSQIQDYLTNGGMSIPILVVRDANGKDLFHWGPRPKDAQELFLNGKADGKTWDDQKVTLQNWYNADKGEQLQEELLHLFGAQ